MFIFKTIKGKSFELLIINNCQSQTIHVLNEYMQGLINILSSVSWLTLANSPRYLLLTFHILDGQAHFLYCCMRHQSWK